MSPGPVVDNETIIAVVKNHPKVVVKTQEVADEIAIDQQQTGNRLKELRADGEVDGRRVGQGYVWWHPSNVASLD